jgi:hypothetical protein
VPHYRLCARLGDGTLAESMTEQAYPDGRRALVHWVT